MYVRVCTNGEITDVAHSHSMWRQPEDRDDTKTNHHSYLLYSAQHEDSLNLNVEAEDTGNKMLSTGMNATDGTRHQFRNALKK